jgi:chemotaxis protein MotB
MPAARLGPLGGRSPESPGRRRRRAEPDTTHRDRWIVSYADFITLLFAFFTTMYAISTVDAQKLGRIVMAMQSAFATRGTGGRADGPPPVPASMAAIQAAAAPLVESGGPDDAPAHDASAGPTVEASLSEVQRRLMQELGPELARGDVEISMDQRGLLISVPEAASFSLGSADLSIPARRLFERLGRQLLTVGNLVRVEGHTDDTPIRTARYASNWELSTARATNVVAFLSEQVGMPASRLSAAGYGQFRPRAENDSPQNRAGNRRVDMVVLNPATTRAEEPRGVGK